MARIFWPFLTLESVSLVVRTVAVLYIFSITAATSSVLAVGCAISLMVVGRRTYRWTYRWKYRWTNGSFGTIRYAASSARELQLALLQIALFGFRNNSVNALDLARVQV